MSVKLITLNIELDKHIERVIPFLEKEKAEIICLQEIFASDFDKLRKKLAMGGYFYPTAYIDNNVHSLGTKNGLLGVAIMSNLIYGKSKADYYLDKNRPALTHSGISDGVLFYSRFYKNNEIFHIGTTHFTWSPKGEVTEIQRESFDKLRRILGKIPDFVMCGDFNAPRGKEIYNAFLNEGFRDNLPLEIKSTLDSKYHRKKDLELVVDNIFSKGKYEVNNVRVIEGVSDHKAIIGEVSVKH